MTHAADETEALIEALEGLCANLEARLNDELEGYEDLLGGAAPDEAPGPGGLQWRPLLMGSLPGLDQILGIVNPPLQIIVAVLQAIVVLIRILKAILLSLPDPFRALIEAAYKMLSSLILDLLNSGFYLYADAPGISSPAPGVADLTELPDLEAAFAAGQAKDPRPPYSPDIFDIWARRFEASFDDAGDAKRPVLSPGASVAAVFIVATGPNIHALRPLLYQIGRLLNYEPFVRAWTEFTEGSPDPRRSRARGQSVAPDWHAARLQDAFPPLRELLAVPEALRSLLLRIDGLTALIGNLVSALENKVQTLLELAQTIQSIIDLLESLKASGLSVLAVTTHDGVKGLSEAFARATGRPAGGAVGGICLLASGPDLANASALWSLLGQGGAFETVYRTFEQTYEETRDALDKEGVDEELNALGTSIKEDANAFVEAVKDAPADFVEDMGEAIDDLEAAAEYARSELWDDIKDAFEGAGEDLVTDPIREGGERVDRAREEGARALALGFGAPPVDAALGQVPEEEESDSGGDS